MGSTVGVLDARGSGECGLGLVAAWMRLAPVPSLVEWSWAKIPFQSAQLGPQSICILLGLWTSVAPTSPWKDSKLLHIITCLMEITAIIKQ